MSDALLVQELDVNYGPVRAVRAVGLALKRGEIHVLLGANGAGKSTTIKAIIGVVKARRGRIECPAGQPVHDLAPHKRNAIGIAWVPEGRHVFANLTVQENLLVGAFNVRDSTEMASRLARIHKRFPILQNRHAQLAGSLSGGEQQMLAIGRALMSNPSVLLLDEPSLGLAPKIVADVFRLVSEIRGDGVSVLMAEQNARMALDIADHAYILEHGVVAGEGSAAEMRARDDVRQAYLGG